MKRRGETPTQRLIEVGFAAQDHRASVARSARRLDAGEPVAVCPSCGCEVDVDVPAHDGRCPGRRAA